MFSVNTAKVLVPVGAVAFAGAAVSGAIMDGRALWARVLVGVLVTTATVGVAAHFGVISLGQAAKAT